MKKSTISFIVVTLIMIGCKKKTEETPAPVQVAGKGGNVTIVAFPQHHSKPILSKANYPDTVFVKFNTQEYPGSLKNFDTLYVGEKGEDHVHCSGLKPGNYYLFATGLDTTIHQRVKGGRAYTVTVSSGEDPVNIPVTE